MGCNSSTSTAPQVNTMPEKNDELEDIDLRDPELNSAAIKIQAQFRGHRLRKQIDEVLTEEEAKMAIEEQAEMTHSAPGDKS